MSELPDRLARRRREVRRQIRRRQIRRRRLTFLAAVFALVAVPVFLITRGGTPEAPVQQTVAAKTGGAQPDSTWKPSKAPVPILMYHVIGDPAGEVTYPDLFLSTSDFREQVEWLDENEFTAVTLNQVQDAWFDGATLPEKPVVLSFDDGYLGQYTDAMPILRKHGWAGLLNLKAEGSDLNSTEVKKMIRAGWEIASHTINHLDMTSLSPEQVQAELVDSRRILEKDLGIQIDNFCYPAGRYNDEVAAAVKAAGYRGATTTDPGLARKDQPFELKRIRVFNGEGSETLAAALGA